MTPGVPDSVARAGAAAAARTADQLADAVRAAVPGVSVARTGDGIVVTGRGVLSEPLLRWPAGLLR
ncbi:hypothetical protein [uncultured Sphingomonas sp.]|uniref:hypothetical protein n=1 Tax=uncultured Sphingomonas sp. TaxID=158754 RepID=UPI0035CC90F4